MKTLGGLWIAPCAYRLPGHVPKEQRHIVTADLLEATAHKQCRPRNSAILLRSFLSSDVIEPEEQRHFVTANLLEATAHKQCCPRNSAILLRSFLSSDVIEPKEQRHIVTERHPMGRLWEEA